LVALVADRHVEVGRVRSGGFTGFGKVAEVGEPLRQIAERLLRNPLSLGNHLLRVAGEPGVKHLTRKGYINSL
jgi:hypothetical protein